MGLLLGPGGHEKKLSFLLKQQQGTEKKTEE